MARKTKHVTAPTATRLFLMDDAIMHLRIIGLSLAEIGRHPKVTAFTRGNTPITAVSVHHRIKKRNEELNQSIRESHQELLNVQHRRFEMIISRLMVAALPGPSTDNPRVVPDPRSEHVPGLLRSLDLESKLLGLNSAEKLTVEVTRQAEEMIRTFASIARRYIAPDRMNSFLADVTKEFEKAIASHVVRSEDAKESDE